MKMICLLAIISIMNVLGWSQHVGALDGVTMSNTVGGACVPNAYTDGKVSAGVVECTPCVHNTKCDTAQTETSCVDLQEGDSVTKCGTCYESCGGTRKD